MKKNSYAYKNIYKLKKNNSTSLSFFNSNKNKHHLYTYDLDKREECQNSVGSCNTMIGRNLNKKNSNEKNGSYISIKVNKIIKNNSHKNKEIHSLKDEFQTKTLIKKAPTYCDNKQEINKIIRKKKIEKLMDYENFYNNMKTQHSFFNKNKTKILENKIKNMNLLGPYSKINSYKSSSSTNIFSDLLSIKKINRHKKNIFTEEDIKLSTKYKSSQNNSYASNRVKKRNFKIIKETTIFNDNEKNSENKENLASTNSNYFYHNNNNGVLMTLLPLIPKSKKYKKKNNESPKSIVEKSQEKGEIRLDNFATQRLGNNILLNLKKKTRTAYQLTDLEKNMAKLKYFQNIQKIRLGNIISSDKFNIDKTINYLIKLNRKYNNIWANYRQKINLYLHFLFDKKNDLEMDLGIIMREKKINENTIERLMIQSVKKQKELEELVQTRNFILQVKLKLKEQPAYFASLVHRDSHKIELGNILLTSTVGTKNSSVIRFLDSFSILNLVQLYEINPTNSLMKLFRKKMKNRRIIPKEFREKYIYQEDLLKNEKDNYMPKKGEKFFENPEHFLDTLHNLESKNVFLLNKNNSIQKYSSIMKQEYESEYLTMKENENQAEIYEEIIYREKYLLRLKEKTEELKEKLKSLSNKEYVDNNEHTKKIIKSKANSSFVELNFFRMINYIRILEGYKYYGVLLLEKLISIVKTFIGLNYGDYTIERCYIFIEKTELNHILKLSKKSFNENNKNKVYDYILQLIKLYDDIIEYVKNIQKKYEVDENNKIFMKKRTEEVQTLRKISNARETRELLDDKRERVIEKILEKWQRPFNKPSRKIDDNYFSKMKNKYRSKSIEDIKLNKNDKKQDEVDGLIFFE